MTDFNWLKYETNFYRYDTFSFIYNFCFSDFLNDNIEKLDEMLKTINELKSKIYNNPISENRNLLWKYFINFSAFCSKKGTKSQGCCYCDQCKTVNNKFDINKTSINFFTFCQNKRN